MLSIILVNYKTADLMIECIKSIYSETTEKFEIIVVDNLSNDESEAKICKAFNQVKWIQMNYNSGFARANNAGILASKGDLILLLNSDTIILNKAIDKVVEKILKNKNIIACGVQLLNKDGSKQISGAKNITGGLNLLLPLPYLGSLIRSLGYILKSKIPSIKNVNKETEVDWIIGAFIMFKTSVLKDAGLLDENFFMYAEEIEWCSRLKKSGKLVLYGDAKIIHLGGGSSKQVYENDSWNNSTNLWSNKARQIILSNMLRIRKQFGLIWFLLIWFAYFFSIPIFFGGLLFEKIIKNKKAKYTWKNFKNFSSNLIALLPYFFKLLINKKYFYKIN